MEWPTEGAAEAPAQKQYSARMWYRPPGYKANAKAETSIRHHLPRGEVHGCRNQGVEAEVTTYTVIPNNLLVGRHCAFSPP